MRNKINDSINESKIVLKTVYNTNPTKAQTKRTTIYEIMKIELKGSQ